MPLVIFSSIVRASSEIAKQLLKLAPWHLVSQGEWTNEDITLLDCKSDSIINVPTDFDTDCIIVLSPHKNKSGLPEITAHFPGNWNTAYFGGESRTLNVAYASKLKVIIKEMKRLADEEKSSFTPTLEADHHGPTCNVPIIYAELGVPLDHEATWDWEGGAKIVAKAVFAAIKSSETFESVIGAGGGHYPDKFNEIMFSSDMAVGHVLPKYQIDALEEIVFAQAIEKNVEKVSRVLALKGELNKKQREKLRALCEKFSVSYEEI